MQNVTPVEHDAIQRANASGRPPVVFVHGLWLLPNSWDRWLAYFQNAGYAAIAPGWPDDPQTVDQARATPETFARKSIGEIADHYEEIIRGLDRQPVVIGHSFGGLLAQMLASRALARTTVAISPAPFRGVLPLPISALKSAWPVLKNPGNRNSAVPLTFDQFRYAFANAVPEDEAKELFEAFAVPGAGLPLFESAAANLNPWTEDRVPDSPNRGPLLIIAGELDHTVPPAVCKAEYTIQQRNSAVTEYLELPGRGHALTIDSAWQDVARAAQEFVARFAPVTATHP